MVISVNDVTVAVIHHMYCFKEESIIWSLSKTLFVGEISICDFEENKFFDIISNKFFLLRCLLLLASLEILKTI